MGIETLRKCFIRKSKFSKKGPFGIFTKKLTHKKEGGNIFYDKIQDQIVFRSQGYRELSTCRFWNFYKDFPVYKRGILRYKRFLKDENHKIYSQCSSTDAILNYFLYSTLPVEEKEKLSQIYEERYNIQINSEFSKEYAKPSYVNCIRRSDFILWMNHYLENNFFLIFRIDIIHT